MQNTVNSFDGMLLQIAIWETMYADGVWRKRNVKRKEMIFAEKRMLQIGKQNLKPWIPEEFI